MRARLCDCDERRCVLLQIMPHPSWQHTEYQLVPNEWLWHPSKSPCPKCLPVSVCLQEYLHTCIFGPICLFCVYTKRMWTCYWCSSSLLPDFVCVCFCACVYISVYLCFCVCVCVCMFLCVCVCVYVSVCLCVRVSRWCVTRSHTAPWSYVRPQAWWSFVWRSSRRTTPAASCRYATPHGLLQRWFTYHDVRMQIHHRCSHFYDVTDDNMPLKSF